MEQRRRWSNLVWLTLVVTIAILTVGATGISIGQRIEGNKAQDTEMIYVLYIGLNDKDTYQQEIPTIEAEQAVNEICLQYVDGYTISEAKGAWKDETGAVTEENTLVCSFQGVGEDSIEAIVDEILPTLNQNAILVEGRNTECRYYYSENKEKVQDETGRK